jgi:hypothetical protein
MTSAGAGLPIERRRPRNGEGPRREDHNEGEIFGEEDL